MLVSVHFPPLTPPSGILESFICVCALKVGEAGKETLPVPQDVPCGGPDCPKAVRSEPENSSVPVLLSQTKPAMLVCGYVTTHDENSKDCRGVGCG